MSNDTAQQVQEKLDIAEFVKGYVTLIPAGKNFKANCPFHKEKTPSFMVSSERQTWHCFGSCATGGDIFAFLMRYENIEFFEALKILAEKAGIELRHTNPEEQRQFGVLYDLNQVAKVFFCEELTKDEKAIAYLKSRGLNKETVGEFELGFAPNKMDTLTLYLIKKGFNVTDVERSGLAFKGDRGGYADRFRGRIMFPIHNHFGKTVGFTGRVMPEFDNGTMGKYVNSPETAIFKKSKLLYGFDKTKNAIREANSALLVEGQMDLLMCYQDGIQNVVATSGTALTGDHMVVLRKDAETLVLCFDNDEAGIAAAERGIDLSNQHDFNVKTLLIPPPYKDPADVAEKAPGTLLELVKSATSAMEFYFSHYLTDETDKKSLRTVLTKIKMLSSAIDRGRWLKKLAERANVPETDLREEMEVLKQSVISSQESVVEQKEEEPLTPTSRREMIAQNLLAFCVAKENFSYAETAASYLPERYQKVLAYFLSKPRREAVGAPTEASEEKQPNESTRGMADMISMKSGFLTEENERALQLELKKEYLREKKQEVFEHIQNAEVNGNHKELEQLIKVFDQITKELHNLG